MSARSSSNPLRPEILRFLDDDMVIIERAVGFKVRHRSEKKGLEISAVATKKFKDLLGRYQDHRPPTIPRGLSSSPFHFLQESSFLPGQLYSDTAHRMYGPRLRNRGGEPELSGPDLFSNIVASKCTILLSSRRTR